DQLKAALDKIGKSSSGYKAAKAKYDALEKAIKSIKTINANFDKPAIVDGELDTTANVKSDAKFDSVSTGLTAVDALLT
ncbi:cell division site-positioning protein MapZ family protein, partial [Streptococcus pyogenes]